MRIRTAIAIAALTGLGVALGIFFASRGSGDAVSLGPAPNVVTGSEISSTLPAQPSVEVWLARGEQIIPVARPRGSSPGVATAAVRALLAGPTKAERRAGATTAVPPDTGLLGISIENGVATVDLTSEFQSGGGSLSMQLRLAQVVFTLTQFPTVKKVRFQLDGEAVDVFSDEGIILDHPVGRSDYKDLAPTSPPLTGTWGMLPAAPIPAPDLVRSVWTGDEMIVFGRVDKRGSHGEILSSTNVAAAYDPKANSWRRLAAPFSAPGYPGNWNAVWSGKEMIVLGDVDQAFDPEQNRWRRLPPAPAGRAGIAVWTGKELVEWGGGCCGDASDDGAAYDPSSNTWRKLPAAPVGGRQSPVGAWTGKELVIFPGRDPDGKSVGGAAYDPAKNSWRPIGRNPEPAPGATAIWDGHEVVVVEGWRASGPSTATLAYDPATNVWRRLAATSGRVGAAIVWTGSRFVVWGGKTGPGATLALRHGQSYEPIGNRWSPLPRSPLPGRVDQTAVWTGRELIVWGGSTNSCLLNKPCHIRFHADGAAFRPTAP
ncbi:MAG TPA: GerMN domain-containing protein [Gaiellaceae bacterium]